jgi:hypothetical protein
LTTVSTRPKFSHGSVDDALTDARLRDIAWHRH